jgi:hypothetical protein
MSLIALSCLGAARLRFLEHYSGVGNIAVIPAKAGISFPLRAGNPLLSPKERKRFQLSLE